jgi:hypothetical protein
MLAETHRLNQLEVEKKCEMLRIANQVCTNRANIFASPTAYGDVLLAKWNLRWKTLRIAPAIERTVADLRANQKLRITRLY